MPDWATSGRVKIERANEHIRDLEARSKGFLNPAPYRLVCEDDPQTRETIDRWQRLPHARGIPPVWGAIAGDAIHNLRSALDVLWRQATNPLPGKRDPRRKGSYFPFDNPDRLKARRAGQIQPAVKAALDIVIQFKPYQTGNQDLWLLNEASVIDKHEVPIIVVCAFVRGIMNFPATGPMHPIGLQLTLKATAPVLVEHGKIFARDVRGRPHAHQDDQFAFDIAFGECGALESKPVLPTLHAFASVTNTIADAFIHDRLVT